MQVPVGQPPPALSRSACFCMLRRQPRRRGALSSQPTTHLALLLRCMQIAAAVRAKGGLFLEAPVSGSRKPAEEGQLIFLTAGGCRREPPPPCLNVLLFGIMLNSQGSSSSWQQAGPWSISPLSMGSPPSFGTFLRPAWGWSWGQLPFLMAGGCWSGAGVGAGRFFLVHGAPEVHGGVHLHGAPCARSSGLRST